MVSRVVGPIATNVHVLADERTREAIAIDTAIPCLDWIAAELAERAWTLKLIVSTHGHWDHIGDNAAVAAHAGADIAVHPLDRERLVHPSRSSPRSTSRRRSPPSSWPRAGSSGSASSGSRSSTRPATPRARSACSPGTTGRLFSGDTLFAGGWGRVDLPGGSAEAMAASIARLSGLEDRLAVLPGHGPSTTIGRERPWMELVRDAGRLFA